MNMVKGKACPKCGSKSVYLDYDLGGWFEHCLMCGAMFPMDELELPEEILASLPGDFYACK